MTWTFIVSLLAKVALFALKAMGFGERARDRQAGADAIQIEAQSYEQKRIAAAAEAAATVPPLGDDVAGLHNPPTSGADPFDEAGR